MNYDGWFGEYYTKKVMTMMETMREFDDDDDDDGNNNNNFQDFSDLITATKYGKQGGSDEDHRARTAGGTLIPRRQRCWTR